MRKSFTLALAGIVAIGAILFLTRCGGDDPIPADKAVSVAAQQGTITAGTAGEAAFAVTTANIADGKGGSIAWYTTAEGTSTTSAPAGITPAVTYVASNAATVTMAATTAVQEGTYYFKVAIDGAESNTAALKVSTYKAVSVAVQEGTITAGTAGEAAFAVTTANIADGKGGTVTWYTTAAGTTTASAPAGIAPSVTDVASDAAEVTMAATNAAKEGTYYFKVTIDGVVSNTATLRVSPEGGESHELNGTTWLAVQLQESEDIFTMTLEFTSDTEVSLTAAGGSSEDIPDGTYDGTYIYMPPTVSLYFMIFGEIEFTIELAVSGNIMGGGDNPLFLKQTGDATQEYHIIVTDGGGGSALANGIYQPTAAAGETVSLNATPDSGEYEFNKWTVLMGGITLSPDANTPDATFTMPASVVVVKAEFEELGANLGGIIWAKRNVDMPGTFAAKPEDFGMFYQWGKNVGWSSTNPLRNSDGGTTWDSTTYNGNEWLPENDPCPEGWRVPDMSDFNELRNGNAMNNEWTQQGGVNGRMFTDTATGKSIFLPAAGYRSRGDSNILREQGSSGACWSSTPSTTGTGYGMTLSGTGAFSDFHYTFALSVRCVRL